LASRGGPHRPQASLGVLIVSRLPNPECPDRFFTGKPQEFDYSAKLKDVQPAFSLRDLVVRNQYGVETFSVLSPDSPCVPSQKFDDGEPTSNLPAHPSTAPRAEFSIGDMIV